MHIQEPMKALEENKMKFRWIGKEMWDMSKIPPGLQLYTLRNETKVDFFGTLKKVAEMGYKLVGFAGYEDIPAIEMKKALDHLGLGTVSSFVDINALEKDLNNQIQYALTLGVRYIITAAPKERFKDESEIQTLISSLRKIGRELKRHGLQFLYHPHDFEVEKIGGKRIIDRLLDSVGTDLMQLALDLYWAKKGGLDPKTALQTYKGLVPIIDIKDMDKKGDFTEIGGGIIDWPSIFRILKDVGVKYYFVEQDVSPHPLQSAKMSIDYLKSIGVV
jgi:sugar phosphate isomerase/epimerase